MSHTVKVTMTADQEISIRGEVVNIHDIQTIFVDDEGLIVFWQPKSEQEPPSRCPECKHPSHEGYYCLVDLVNCRCDRTDYPEVKR